MYSTENIQIKKIINKNKTIKNENGEKAYWIGIQDRIREKNPINFFTQLH